MLARDPLEKVLFYLLLAPAAPPPKIVVEPVVVVKVEDPEVSVLTRADVVMALEPPAPPAPEAVVVTVPVAEVTVVLAVVVVAPDEPDPDPVAAGLQVSVDTRVASSRSLTGAVGVAKGDDSAGNGGTTGLVGAVTDTVAKVHVLAEAGRVGA